MIIVLIVLVIALICCMIKLRMANEELAEAQRKETMQRVFLKNISHEIRTPLHTVIGLAETLSDETLYLSKSEKTAISEQIKHSTRLISTILNELMLLNAQQKEIIINEREQISPNFLCRRCLEASKEQNEKPGLRISFKRELGDEFSFTTDSRMLELILNKLIVNACQYTEKGEVVVGCNTTENPDKLTIYVQDTGVGIPQDRKNELFNWFDKPDEAREKAELDLSIAQKLASRLGGVIRLDPLYIKGTRVVLILPL